MAFRAADRVGLVWDYAGTILEARSAPSSEKGPNENSLALLADGTSIICVLRLDAGDGPATHPFLSYVKSTSTDGGFTWSKAVPLGKGVGCARPRLLALSGGGLVLSGGRLHRGNWDNYLWVNAAGDGVSWVAHSLSYTGTTPSRPTAASALPLLSTHPQREYPHRTHHSSPPAQPLALSSTHARSPARPSVSPCR